VLGFSVNSHIQQTPILIQGLKNIIDVACGNDHALALDNKGKAWAWGNSRQNELGRPVHKRRIIQGLIPREVEISRKKVKSIHSGSFHSFAVTTDGSIYSWGLNSFSQCGIYMEQPEEEVVLQEEEPQKKKPQKKKPQEEVPQEMDPLVVPIPTRVPALQDKDIVMLDGGDKHSIALTSDGDLLAWGNMTAHQVGIGPNRVPAADVILDMSGKPRCLIFPTKVTETKFKTIASGSNHNIAIGLKDGAAYSWGFGDQYQCGHGKDEDVEVPTKIVNTATTGVNMVAAACGGHITVLAGIPTKTD
jgi:regulator of chromosome condensation